MDGTQIALVLTAFFSGITGLVAACFAGWVAIRQLPAVHKIVNSKSDAQLGEIARLNEKVEALQQAATTKSDENLVKAETRAGERAQGERPEQ